VPRLALTDRFVATCKCSKGKSQIDYFDARTPGLALRVTEQGHKRGALSSPHPVTGNVHERPSPPTQRRVCHRPAREPEKRARWSRLAKTPELYSMRKPPGR
jgi:hypothetical protein